MIFAKALVILAFFVTIASVQSESRVIGGVPIDTLNRFPYHVTIEPIREVFVAEYNVCGGSILNDQWILTSALCLANSLRVRIHFERLYINNIQGSYTAVVNYKEDVFPYPTESDDIALVRIPFRLIFSDTIQTVSVSTTPIAQLVDKFAVLPGFNNADEYSTISDIISVAEPSESDQLSYVKLKVISNSNCKTLVTADFFDVYLQMCTEGYNHSLNAPCFTDWGSGLVIGWPTKPELVGIFSKFYGYCNGPHVYTNIAKYASWIQETMYICD